MTKIKLYEVGGSLRDEQLGINSDDRDYVAVAPEGWTSLCKWAEGYLDRVFFIKPEFFTIKGSKDKEVFDIVMARKDGAYSDGRRPDTVEPGSLVDDLGRRDFTMNAIARCAATREVFDPFNGERAIRNGVIECVGNPTDRIREDSLRILRAIRFSITKNMRMEDALQEILKRDYLRRQRHGDQYLPRETEAKASKLLSNVSRERISTEVGKIFKHDTSSAIQLLGNEDLVHPDIRNAIFKDDIWLKATREQKTKGKKK